MKPGIIKRLEAIEQHTRNANIPVLITIHYRDDLQSWEVGETFKSGAGSYRSKTTLIDDPTKYDTPKGFEGVCIWDDLSGPPYGMPYDEWAKKQRADDEAVGTRFIYRGYDD